MLVLDESPVKKAGTKTAGAARRWNGRIGHVDLSQVGTFLAFANGLVWTWVDGELFLPERWFGSELAAWRVWTIRDDAVAQGWLDRPPDVAGQVQLHPEQRACEHHLALTSLATWFVAETKLDWHRDHPRGPSLLTDFAIDRLPALSVANVRAMLRAALPLPDLTADRAAALVVEHIVSHTRSRRSRRKRQLHTGHDP